MSERLNYLDTIRGLSILGILFVNIISFGWPELYDSIPSSYWISPMEQTVHEFLRIFIQSNFYPLFAMLFGISMTFVFRSALNRGLNPYYTFSRRLFFLLIIGAIHAFFIWYGDILLVYAILGYLLLPMYQLKSKTLFSIAVFLWLVPNILYSWLLIITHSQLTPIDNSVLIKQVINSYQGNFLELTKQNIFDWTQLYSLQSMPFIFISIFPMFLFGLAFAKSSWITTISNSKYRNLRLVLMFALGFTGFSLKVLPLLDPNSLFLHHLSETFGGPLIGVFYAVVLLTLLNIIKGVLQWLDKLGRMSMTNYLIQSVVGFLFFKILGMYGHTSSTETLVFALVTFFLQLIFSHIWLKHNKHGPIEGIWRHFTYMGIKRS